MLAFITKKHSLPALAVLVLSTTLLSFSTGFGGEGFEIFLNNKVVLQQFGNNMNQVRTLKLDKASESDELAILYHHCGKVGKNRTLVIKDQQDRIVKKLNFKDVANTSARMTFKIKDIIGLEKGSLLKLYYSSTELPGGRQLASLSLPAANLASR
jgi:hypothetical protein